MVDYVRRFASADAVNRDPGGDAASDVSSLVYYSDDDDAEQMEL